MMGMGKMATYDNIMTKVDEVIRQGMHCPNKF
jgi:hypothetical protein